jgi:chromosome segregation ATPase
MKRVAVVCAALWLGVGVGAQPAADLERLQSAIAASRERVAEYEREEHGLLDAIEAIDESAALLRVEAERAGEAARDARAALKQAEASASDAQERLEALERAMARAASGRALSRRRDRRAAPALLRRRAPGFLRARTDASAPASARHRPDRASP